MKIKKINSHLPFFISFVRSVQNNLKRSKSSVEYDDRPFVYQNTLDMAFSMAWRMAWRKIVFESFTSNAALYGALGEYQQIKRLYMVPHSTMNEAVRSDTILQADVAQSPVLLNPAVNFFGFSRQVKHKEEAQHQVSAFSANYDSENRTPTIFHRNSLGALFKTPHSILVLATEFLPAALELLSIAAATQLFIRTKSQFSMLGSGGKAAFLLPAFVLMSVAAGLTVFSAACCAVKHVTRCAFSPIRAFKQAAQKSKALGIMSMITSAGAFIGLCAVAAPILLIGVAIKSLVGVSLGAGAVTFASSAALFSATVTKGALSHARNAPKKVPKQQAPSAQATELSSSDSSRGGRVSLMLGKGSGF